MGPFAYAYRKGAADNPVETQWLNPKSDVLCGLLWEERRTIRRIELEFPPAVGHGPCRQRTGACNPRRVRPVRRRLGARYGARGPTGIHSQARWRSSGDAAGRHAIHLSFLSRTTSTASRWSTPAVIRKSVCRRSGRSAVRNGRSRLPLQSNGPVAPLNSDRGVTVKGRCAWEDGPDGATPRGINFRLSGGSLCFFQRDRLLVVTSVPPIGGRKSPNNMKDRSVWASLAKGALSSRLVALDSRW